MAHTFDGAFCFNTAGIDADAVAARLLEISNRDNGLTPQSVVDDARRKSSPLHDCFEWDDTEAAKEWRLQQARNLIRAIRITPSEMTRDTPRNIFVKTDKVYLPTVQVVQSKTLYDQALGLLLDRVEMAQRSAEDLSKAADDYTKKDKAQKVSQALKSVVQHAKA